MNCKINLKRDIRPHWFWFPFWLHCLCHDKLIEFRTHMHANKWIKFTRHIPFFLLRYCEYRTQKSTTFVVEIDFRCTWSVFNNKFIGKNIFNATFQYLQMEQFIIWYHKGHSERKWNQNKVTMKWVKNWH